MRKSRFTEEQKGCSCVLIIGRTAPQTVRSELADAGAPFTTCTLREMSLTFFDIARVLFRCASYHLAIALLRSLPRQTADLVLDRHSQRRRAGVERLQRIAAD